MPSATSTPPDAAADTDTRGPSRAGQVAVGETDGVLVRRPEHHSPDLALVRDVLVGLEHDGEADRVGRGHRLRLGRDRAGGDPGDAVVRQQCVAGLGVERAA